MKVLHENTKTYSSEVADKMDELKKIIMLQQNTITGNQPPPANPFISGQMNTAQMENFLDP